MIETPIVGPARRLDLKGVAADVAMLPLLLPVWFAWRLFDYTHR